MKIFLPLIMITLLSGTTLMAQDEDSLAVEQAGDKVEQTIDEVVDFVERKGEFGAKVGLNFSTFNDAEILNPDTKTGLHLALYGRYQWTSRLSGKVELMFSSLGARADEFRQFRDYSVNLDYLALPILGELMVADGLRLELGPYFAAVISSRQSFKSLQFVGGDDGGDGTIDINPDSSETSFVDVGFMAGASYQFPSGFGVNLRYQQGFANALGNDFFGDASGSNSAFQFSLLQTF